MGLPSRARIGLERSSVMLRDLFRDVFGQVGLRNVLDGLPRFVRQRHVSLADERLSRVRAALLGLGDESIARERERGSSGGFGRERVFGWRLRALWPVRAHRALVCLVRFGGE